MKMEKFRTLLPYIIVISLFLITNWAYAATFIVDSLEDVDNGLPYTPGDSTNTLRKCIRLANETPGADTINFSLSGTISPTSALPEIYDDGTVIDASLKWIGAWPSGQPGITLDGSGAGSGANGLGIVNGDNCHIRGLFITNFGGNGVFIRGGAQFNTVGGTGIGYRNVISGNGGGVGIVDAGAANNKVSGNYIGSGYGSIPRLHSRGGGPPWSLEFGVGNGAIPNQIGFYLAFADGTNTDWNGVYDVKEEIWYHTAISWDGTWVKVYVNGTEVYSSDRWANKTLNQGTSLIGAAAGHDYFNGLIDEVRIWNYALTQEEIRATMNTTLKGDEPGLVGYWNFDDSTAKDSSPDSNHGTLEGDADIIPLVGTWPPKKIGDVSGNGTISAYDAALILQYVVGLISEFPADSMGSPFSISPRSYIVKIPELSAKAGDRIYVPIAINDATGLFAGGISLKYDRTVLRAIKALPDIALNGSYWKANTELDGEVRFAFATAEPTKGQGNILLVEFEVLPNAEGRTSQLIIDNVNLSNSLNITKINGSVTVIPSAFALLQNYPNPFNPDTWIPFKIASDASVTINIYNQKGQLIRTIALGQKAAGVYLSKDKATYWDGRDDFGEKVSSGVYFYSLRAGKFIATRKLVVVK